MERGIQRIAVLYALTGAAAGVLVNMLCFASPGGQTNLGLGILLTVLGLAAGFVIGSVLTHLTDARPVSARLVVMGGVVLIAAVFGASAGWIGVSGGAGRQREEPIPLPDHEGVTRRGAMVGSVLGAASGVLALIILRILRPGPVTNIVATAAPARPGRPS